MILTILGWLVTLIIPVFATWYYLGSLWFYWAMGGEIHLSGVLTAFFFGTLVFTLWCVWFVFFGDVISISLSTS